MNKPFTSWKRTLSRLGYKVNWQNVMRSKQRRSRQVQQHREQSDLQFDIETLEPRQMLSAAWGSASGVEGVSNNYHFQFDGEQLSLNEQYQIRIDPGDGSGLALIETLDVTKSNRGKVFVDGDYHQTYADDGQYSLTAELLNENGDALQTLTHDTTINNLSPTIEVTGSTSSATAGIAYSIDFAASDLGDDTIQEWEIDWGDGTTETVDGAVNTSFHVYEDDGEYLVSVGATDEDGTYGPIGLTLDNQFGDNGIVTTDFSGTDLSAASTQVQPDGKVIALTSVTTQEILLPGGSDFSFGSSSFFSTTQTETISSNEYFAVDSGQSYRISATANAGDGLGGSIEPSAQQSIGFEAYDINQNLITSSFNEVLLSDQAVGESAETFSVVIGGERDSTDVAGFPTGTAFIRAVASANVNGGIGNQFNISNFRVDPVREYSASDFGLVRYNSDGSLDNSFGDEGHVLIDLSSTGYSSDSATDIIIQDDGRIIVVGYVVDASEGKNFALLRLNSNGTLDNSFGVDGTVSTDFNSNSDDYATAVTVHNNKIVVAGYSFDFNDTDSRNDFAIARYNMDGTLDVAFGIGGKVVTDINDSYDDAQSVVVQADGNILVSGRSYDTQTGLYVAAVVRYTSIGQLDTSFGTAGTGMLTSQFGSGGDTYGDQLLKADNDQFYLTAHNSGDIYVSRYDQDGILDFEYGIDGVTTIDFGGIESVSSAVLLAGGQLAVVGSSYRDQGQFHGQSTLAVALLLPDGSLDQGFGQQGLAIVSEPGFEFQAGGVAASDDGGLYVTGKKTHDSDIATADSTSEHVVARFLPPATSAIGRIANYSYVVLGDVNLDGVTSLLDVTPFTDLIESGQYQPEADINQDGSVSLLDVTPFFEVLTNAAPELDLDSDDSSASGLNYITSFAQGSNPVSIVDNDATLTDSDDAFLESLTVTLINPLDGIDESITAFQSPAFTSYLIKKKLNIQTNGAHQIVISGSGSPDTYLNVLKNQIAYFNSAESPSTFDRTILIVANDGTENSPLAITTVLVTGNTALPTIEFLPIDDLYDLPGANDSTELQVEYTGGDLSNVSFSVVDGGPDWISIQAGATPGTANLVWTLPTNQLELGDYLVTVEAEDLTDSLIVARSSFLFSVVAENTAPSNLTIIDSYTDEPITGPIFVEFGDTVLFDVNADDDGTIYRLNFAIGDALSNSLGTASISNASINPFTGAFQWTPEIGDAGTTATFDIVVTDSGIPPLSTTIPVTISVGYPNSGLSITPNFAGVATTDEDTPLSFAAGGVYPITFDDVDSSGEVLQLTIISENGDLTVDGSGVTLEVETEQLIAATGTVTALNTMLASLVFTPEENYHGDALVEFQVVDLNTSDLRLTHEIPIIVNSVIDDPIIASGQTFAIGSSHIVGETASGESIGTVLLADSEYELPVTFSITNVSGNTGGQFDIDDATGELLVSSKDQLGVAIGELITLTIRSETQSGEFHEEDITATIESSAFENPIEVIGFGLVDDIQRVNDFQSSAPVVVGTFNARVSEAENYRVEFDFDPDVSLDAPLPEVDHPHYIQQSGSGEFSFNFDLTQHSEITDSPGTKTIAYRIQAVDSSNDVITKEIIDLDGGEESYSFFVPAETTWNYFTFVYETPADEGDIRIASAGLLFDTGLDVGIEDIGPDGTPQNDNSTSDPRILAIVNGDLAGQLAQVVFKHHHTANGAEASWTSESLGEPGEIVFDPRAFEFLVDVGNSSLEIALTLETSDNNGQSWQVAEQSSVTFDYYPQPQSNLFISISEPEGESSSFTRRVEGTVSDFSVGSIDADQVVIEFDYPDPGTLTFDDIPDDQTTAVLESGETDLSFGHEFVNLAGPEIQYRVREWSQLEGTWLYGDWQTFQFSAITAPAIYLIEQVNVDENAPRSAPVISGYLTGASEASGEGNFGDYLGVSGVTVQLFHIVGTIPDGVEPDATVTTDAWGHFEYNPVNLTYGDNIQIQARTTITLANGTEIDGNQKTVFVDFEEPVIPTLEAENFQLVNLDDAEEVPDFPGPSTWITSDTRLTGTLTEAAEGAIGFESVYLEFAHDNDRAVTEPADEDVVSVSFSDPSGTFYYSPLSLSLGEVAVKARVVYYDPAAGDLFRSDWTEILLDVEIAQQTYATVSDLSVADNTAEDGETPTSINPTISGQLENADESVSFLTVLIRDDNGLELGRTTADADGYFNYTLQNLSPGEVDLRVVASQWDYNTDTFEEGVEAEFAFVLAAATPREISSFQLRSDSGASQTDTFTSNSLLVGQIEGDGDLSGVTVAIDRAGVVEAIVQTDDDGQFFFQPNELDNGQYTYRARVSSWNSLSSEFDYTSGLSTTFTLVAQAEAAGIVVEVGLANPPEAGDDVFDATVTGRAVDNGQLDKLEVEYEFIINETIGINGTTLVDETGRFTFTPFLLANGTVNIRVRTREVHDDSGTTLYGDWVSLQQFSYQSDEDLPPVLVINGVGLNDSELEVTGVVTNDGSDGSEEGLSVGISLSEDGPLVGLATTGEDGAFSYELTDLVPDESYTVWARAIEYSGSEYGQASEAASHSFTYSPSLYIASFGLEVDTAEGGGDATTSDGITEQVVLAGQVQGPGLSIFTNVEFDTNADGEANTSTSVDSVGDFSFNLLSFNPELEIGYHRILVRATDSFQTTSQWMPVNFIYETDDANPETIAIVQTLESIDTDWQHSDLPLSGEQVNDALDQLHLTAVETAGSEYDFSVAVAEQARALADAASESTYQQQFLDTQQDYQSALNQARADFEQELGQLPADQQVNYDLVDFSWPAVNENRVVISDGESPPALLKYEGQTFDVSRNKQSLSANQNAEKDYLAALSTAQGELNTAISAAESTYSVDRGIAQVQYGIETALAYAEYLASRLTGGPAPINDQIKALEDQLVAAQKLFHQKLADLQIYDEIISTAGNNQTRQLRQNYNLEADEKDYSTTTTEEERIEQALHNYGVDKKFAPIYYGILSQTTAVAERAREQWDRAKYDAIAELVLKQNDIKAEIAKLQSDYHFAVQVELINDRLAYNQDLVEASETRGFAFAVAEESRAMSIAEAERDFGNAVVDARFEQNQATNSAAYSAFQMWANTALDTTEVSPDWIDYQLAIANATNSYNTAINDLVRSRDQAKVVADFDASTRIAEEQRTFAESVVTADKDLGLAAASADAERKESIASVNNERDKDLADHWRQRQDDYAIASRDYRKQAATNGADQRIATANNLDKFATDSNLIIPPVQEDVHYTSGWAYDVLYDNDGGTSNGGGGGDIDDIIVANSVVHTALIHNDQTRIDLVVRRDENSIKNEIRQNTRIADNLLDLALDRISANAKWRLDTHQTQHEALASGSGEETDISESTSIGIYQIEYEYQEKLADARYDHNLTITTKAGEFEIAVATEYSKAEFLKLEADADFRVRGVEDQGASQLTASNALALEVAQLRRDYDNVISQQNQTTIWNWANDDLELSPWERFQWDVIQKITATKVITGNALVSRSIDRALANLSAASGYRTAIMNYAQFLYGSAEGGGTLVDQATAIADKRTELATDSQKYEFEKERHSSKRDRDVTIASERKTQYDTFANSDSERDQKSKTALAVRDRANAVANANNVSTNADKIYDAKRVAARLARTLEVSDAQKRWFDQAGQANEDYISSVGDINDDEAEKNKTDSLAIATTITQANTDRATQSAQGDKDLAVDTANADLTLAISLAVAEKDYQVAVSDSSNQFITDLATKRGEYINTLHNDHVSAADDSLMEATAAFTSNPTAANEKAKFLAEFQYDAAVIRQESAQFDIQQIVEHYNELKALHKTFVTTYYNSLITQAEQLKTITLGNTTAAAEALRAYEVNAAGVEAEEYNALADSRTTLDVEQVRLQGVFDHEIAKAVKNRDDAYTAAGHTRLKVIAPEYAKERFAVNAQLPLTDHYGEYRLAQNVLQTEANEKADKAFDKNVQEIRTQAVEDLGDARIDFVKANGEANVAKAQQINEIDKGLASLRQFLAVSLQLQTGNKNLDHLGRTWNARETRDNALNMKDVEFLQAEKQDTENLAEDISDIEADYHLSIADVDIANAQAVYDTNPLNVDNQYQLGLAKARKSWIDTIQEDFIDFRKSLAGNDAQYTVELEQSSAARATSLTSDTKAFELSQAAKSNQLNINLATAAGISNVLAVTNENKAGLAYAHSEARYANDVAAAEVEYLNRLAQPGESDQGNSNSHGFPGSDPGSVDPDVLKEAEYDRAKALAIAELELQTSRSDALHGYQIREARRDQLLANALANLQLGYGNQFATDSKDFNLSAAESLAGGIVDTQTAIIAWIQRGGEATEAYNSADYAAQVSAADEFTAVMVDDEQAVHPWATYLKQRWVAEESAWNERKDQYLESFGDQAAAHAAYGEAARNARIVAATAVQMKALLVAQEIASAKHNHSNKTAAAVSQQIKGLAGHTQKYYQDVAKAIHKQAVADALEEYDGTSAAQTQAAEVAAAEDLFLEKTQELDATTKKTLANEDALQLNAFAEQSWSLVQETVTAETARDDTTLAAQYGTNGLEYMIIDVNYDYRVLKAQSIANALSQLAADHSSPWANRAEADANANVFRVEASDGDRRTLEKQKVDHKYEAEIEIQSRERSKFLKNGEAERKRITNQAKSILKNAMNEEGEQTDLPIDLILPDPDLGEESLAFLVPDSLTEKIVGWFGGDVPDDNQPASHPKFEVNFPDSYFADSSHYQWSWANSNYRNHYNELEQDLRKGADWSSPTTGLWDYSQENDGSYWETLEDLADTLIIATTDFANWLSSFIGNVDAEEDEQIEKLTKPLEIAVESNKLYGYLGGMALANQFGIAGIFNSNYVSSSDEGYLTKEIIEREYKKQYPNDPLLAAFDIGGGDIIVAWHTTTWSYHNFAGTEISFDDFQDNTVANRNKAVKRLRNHLLRIADTSGSAINRGLSKWDGDVDGFLDALEKSGLTPTTLFSPKQITSSELESLNDGVTFVFKLTPGVGLYVITGELATEHRFSFTLLGQRELSTTEKLVIVGELSSGFVVGYAIKVGGKWVMRATGRTFDKVSDAAKYMDDIVERVPRLVDNAIKKRLEAYVDEMRSLLSSMSDGFGKKFRRGGGNVAVSELEIGDKFYRIPAFSGPQNLDGFAPYIPNPDRILGAGGAGRGAANFLRDVDAEAKILERILSLTTADQRGIFRLYSELPFCDSCQAMIANFHKYRPGFDLELVWKDGSRFIPARF